MIHIANYENFLNIDPVSDLISTAKEIEQLMNNAKDENEGCVSIELVAEFCVLQEELYQEALKKHKEEAN